VDTKEELRPAFYNALGNTVVACNMDHAAEIAYAPGSQLRKVVTLKVSGARHAPPNASPALQHTLLLCLQDMLCLASELHTPCAS
jgi:hypothetical protein